MSTCKTYPTLDHDVYARTRPPQDFWGQVLRTVQGKPVSEEQIAIIVSAILNALDLNKTDTLLDLACGNGALTHRLFNSCAGCLGIDLSEYLISVAADNFATLPSYRFVKKGCVEFVRAEEQPQQFSKALCYGSFAYFSATDAAEVLKALCDRFMNLRSVFIGNLPDKDRAADYYKSAVDSAEIADNASRIGIWRSRSEFAELANKAGWKVQFSSMPSEFYASYYRYDALLTRKG